MLICTRRSSRPTAGNNAALWPRQVRHHAGMPSDATPDEVASLDVAVDAGSGAVRVDDDFATLVLAYAPLTAVPLVPELQLHRTTDMYGLWERPPSAPPFWAVPWAGGQTLAVPAGQSTPRRSWTSGSRCRCRFRSRRHSGRAGRCRRRYRRGHRPERHRRHLDERASQRRRDQAVLEDPLDGDGGDAELVLAGMRSTNVFSPVGWRRSSIARTPLHHCSRRRPRVCVPPERTVAQHHRHDVPVTAYIEDTATKPATVWRFRARLPDCLWC